MSAAAGARFDPEFLAEASGGEFVGPRRGVDRVVVDSREAGPGCLFVALRGATQDGHDFVRHASERGCALALVERARVAAVESALARRVPGQPGGPGRPREAGAPEATTLLVVDDSLGALQRIAAAHRRRLRGTVIGITGSAGKTTTRRMLAAILARCGRGTQSPKSFNNHVGVPLTLLGADVGDAWCIAEIGMNAPGEIAALTALADPDGGVVVSVGSAHLGGVGSLDAIALEKAALPLGVRPGGWIVAPAPGTAGGERLASALARAAGAEGDDRSAAGAASPQVGGGRRMVFFDRGAVDGPGVCAGGCGSEEAGRDAPDLAARSSGGRGADARLLARRVEVGGQRILVEFASGSRLEIRLALPGLHMALNALAAIAAARCCAAGDDAIVAGLESVRPEAMRLESTRLRLGRHGAVDLLNDAYNANPESLLAGVRAFLEVAREAPRRVAILGDMLELGAAAPELHRDTLRRVLAAGDPEAPRAESGRLDLLVLVGPLFSAAATELASGVPMLRFPEWRESSRGSEPSLGTAQVAGADGPRSGDGADLATIIAAIAPGDALYLKASRGMALERIENALRMRSATSRPEQPEGRHADATR
ncbi:MAG TPA: UDP-N-acetylmuramoyl-tripeptide--D-alanyl-D-alanine ligase [Phycisphaerales bacterium]|nr:UDP-N-acetylmuramoyl-tripeptide--D-alanyl-D-alanine ligase [Phycisphaerales bacterium]HMP36584.1 UDP-N-acetylmuramoyl-tripeptide--D-alanyl-D-alanine ligase [Phycisphaerales bacterium]